MNWREILEKILPRGLGAGPGQRRQDILDELEDHMDCAARRESLRTLDDTAVEQAVLERFGDPSRIALQIWKEDRMERNISVSDRRSLLPSLLMLLIGIIAWRVCFHIALPGINWQEAIRLGLELGGSTPVWRWWSAAWPVLLRETLPSALVVYALYRLVRHVRCSIRA